MERKNESMKTKYYNKQIYKTEKIFRLYIIILISFCVGFIAGYFATKDEMKKNETINNEMVYSDIGETTIDIQEMK